MWFGSALFDEGPARRLAADRNAEATPPPQHPSVKQTEPAPHSAVLTHGMKVQTCWTHATVFSAVVTQLQDVPQDEEQPSPEHPGGTVRQVPSLVQMASGAQQVAPVGLAQIRVTSPLHW
jgi:hypothetical protein